jgi:L-ascorbate metabolism protein UlaG (beta-lactamase superfamily)
MNITQIRNATLLVEYAGKTLLIDPLLAERGAYPGFAGTANSHLANPLVDLPVPLATLLAADAVLVTHLHLDHWDETARRTRRMRAPSAPTASPTCGPWTRMATRRSATSASRAQAASTAATR